MTIRSRRPLAAWLALAAMWLIVFAPLVSQLIEAYRPIDPASEICSVSRPHGGSHHESPDNPLAACGYCGFLSGHPTVPTAPAALLPLLIVAAGVPDAPRIRLFVPLGTFPSGRPRDPPRHG
ncbi:DUF2946 domain-containing protein [Bordetella genomosp. 9]|uniref:DUF2946 domain-containing protein n=1 Tax=Bordetella genomosp. 9 TaxID=1416803 RepID=A0A1W6YW07_9BORD|nr:DUF2946 domain-containing protein [Bordetella genomosp. 9]ARP85292.1 hypothetical protein CAL13_02970 [Bordetella genomosp. 9]ARP89276.1 hypothetical protein CAL14_02350 [Bordetella genomosp. 9]